MVIDFQDFYLIAPTDIQSVGPSDYLAWEIKFPSSFYAGIRALQVILFRQGL